MAAAAALAACAPNSAAHQPAPRVYRTFEDVPYGYSGEESLWSPRAGAWIHVAELPPATTAPSTAAPVLLLHPWSTNMLVWRDVAPELQKTRRVVLVDLPGHGKSGKPAGEYPVRRLAGAVLDVLDHLGIDRAILVGNSIGGATSMEAALLAPKRVRALVLVDAPGGHALDGPLASLVVLGTRPSILHTLAEPGYSIAWWMMTPSMPPISERLRDDIVALESTPEHAAWSRATSSALREVIRWRGHVEDIRAPTLVVQGADDRAVPASAAKALEARIPGAKLEVIEDCGHMPELECPARLLERIAPFLADK